MAALRTAADGLVDAARGGDGGAVSAAARELGGACRGCHTDFRVRRGG